VRTPLKEMPRESPPPLSCSTGAHHIPVRRKTRAVIPSSQLVPWRRSCVGGSRKRKVKASRTKAKDKVKASQTKVKMSSSGSEGTAPASTDQYGEPGAPPGSSPAPVGGVIPGVALPASKADDAPLPTLLAPTMLMRLSRAVVGVVPGPLADVNTTERFQKFLAMRPDLATSWTREQPRGFLSRLDKGHS